jgi:hypothetical protein
MNASHFLFGNGFGTKSNDGNSRKGDEKHQGDEVGDQERRFRLRRRQSL